MAHTASAMLRDIRELTDQQEAYAEELRRRWGGLLSYRYIGRDVRLDGSARRRGHRHGAPRHAQCREAVCCSRCSASRRPRAVTCRIWRRCPTRSIHSCQILDPGRDVRRIEIVSEELKRGRQMRLQPGQDRRRRPAGPGARADRGPGRQHRRAARGPAEDGGRQHRGGRLPRSAAAVAGVRRVPARPTDTGRLPELSAEVASPDAALHIGPQFVILETAAADAAAALAPTAAGHLVRT